MKDKKGANLLERKLEKNFQRDVIKDIKKRFKGSIVCKMDANYIQGIPDLLVLYEDKWATLECKRSANSPRRPNQEHYVKVMDGMSFSRFIYPENKESVLDELQQSFGIGRDARLPKRK